MKIAVLASGELGYKAVKFLIENYGITCIFSDSKSEKIYELAKSNSIPVFLGNPRNGKATDFIADKRIDVLLSVNYIFLIENDLIEWPDLFAINLHGSLLPKYRGRTPHVWAIINGEKETGITAHLIDQGCDTGPIVEQIAIPIREDHTGADLLNIFHEKYPELLARVLESIMDNTINPVQQDDSKASFFGKRTPEDGHIDWNWPREQIRNWVRAQAHPYPGAFSYYQGRKITIHKIRFSSLDSDSERSNGQIIESEPNPVIKTSNGNVELIDYLGEGDIKLMIGESLT